MQWLRYHSKHSWWSSELLFQIIKLFSIDVPTDIICLLAKTLIISKGILENDYLETAWVSL